MYLPFLTASLGLLCCLTNAFQPLHGVDLSTALHPSVSPHEHNISEFWFTQKLDNFNPQDHRTWQQRYFVSRDYYEPGGPIFLFLGGEWTSDGAVERFGFFGELARQNGALTIDLEQRYYGMSRPTPNVSTENLRYLSIDQAVADAATFASVMREDMTFAPGSTKWMVFGASFSGNLAAAARTKYPHLFYAAYASCAPVLCVLEDHEYLEVINDIYESVDPECLTVFSEGMSQFDELMTSGDGATISRMFNTCEAEFNQSNSEDVDHLVWNVVNVFTPSLHDADANNLTRICDTVRRGPGSYLENMAAEVRRVYGTCTVSRYQDVVAYYRDNIAWDLDITRKFSHQQCVEVGSSVTYNSQNQPFGNRITLDYYLRWCSGLYGPQFTQELMEAGIARTNLEFGGNNPNVTRVLYTQGTHDPWRTLCMQEASNKEAPVLKIEGASHILDLLPPLPTDTMALKQARLHIGEIIRAWAEE